MYKNHMFKVLNWKIQDGVLHYTREHGKNMVEGKFTPKRGNIARLLENQQVESLEVVGIVMTKVGLRVNIILKNNSKIPGDTKEICVQ